MSYDVLEKTYKTLTAEQQAIVYTLVLSLGNMNVSTKQSDIIMSKKEGAVMQIIPIKDLRDTNKISDLCNKSNEPIFITKNGYGDMVVMSIKTYEEKLERIEMYESILNGLANVEEGKIKDGPCALKELKAKYDL